MIYYRKIAFLTGFMFLLLCAPRQAEADIDELQAMRFGKWAITNNSAPHSITVQPNGSYSTSTPTLIMLTPPQPGIYTVTDLPAFHVVNSVDVTMTQPMQGDGPNLTVEDFTVQIPAADGTGTTTLTIGGTAKTSGTAQGYGDDTYTGELHIEINL